MVTRSPWNAVGDARIRAADGIIGASVFREARTGLDTFERSTLVLGLADASFFAADLFRAAFGAAFPVPPPPGAPGAGAWRQYVALYRWSPERIETVAFVNFIRRGDAWLEGGLCAQRSFYRRLPPAHFAACKARGGIVQLMLEAAARELDDAAAWFGYCGDAKSWRVSERIGYEHTGHRYLKVKWFRAPPEPDRRRLVDEIAALGPF